MNNYVGNKGGQGIREFLINYIPLSSRYFSLFYGAGGFENSKLMNGSSWICSEKNPANKKYETVNCKIRYLDYRSLIDENVFTPDDFIFADPPYKLSTRKSGRKYYKFEFDTKDHIEFLNYTRSIPSKILITHPPCKLYDSYLSDWHKQEFRYMTRNGWFTDAIYFNYSPESIVLFNYNFLGLNAIDRQRIKRKRANFISKISELPIQEQKAILLELKKDFSLLIAAV